MGHQVNFYALPSDIADVERAILRTGDVVIIHSRSQTEHVRVVKSFDLQEGDSRWLFFYLVRQEDMSNLVVKHVQAQGYWTIDDTRSPVVEFTSCYFDGTILRRGRVWYADGFYGPAREWLIKAEPFRKWAKTILTTVRSCLSKWNGDYIGPAAKEWAKSGGRLAQS